MRQRKVFVTIDDDRTYRRVTVQLHGRGIVERDVVSGGLIKIKSQQVIRADDFLVAEIDAKVGGFGIVPANLDGAIVSSHYFTFEIDAATLLPRFLAILVRVGMVTREIEKFVRGSLNYAAIRPRHVVEACIPYASVFEQQAIVDAVARVDEIRTATKNQLEALEALPAALLRQAFKGRDSDE